MFSSSLRFRLPVRCFLERHITPAHPPPCKPRLLCQSVGDAPHAYLPADAFSSTSTALARPAGSPARPWDRASAPSFAQPAGSGYGTTAGYGTGYGTGYGSSGMYGGTNGSMGSTGYGAGSMYGGTAYGGMAGVHSTSPRSPEPY